jgi:FMN-binding domain
VLTCAFFAASAKTSPLPKPIGFGRPYIRWPALVLTIGLLLPATPRSQEQGRETVYLAPEAFLAEVFGAAPKASVLWLTPEIRGEVAKILGHAPGKLRERYWSEGTKSAWILEEIGKEELISAGFVVSAGRIERASVLVYRESRGMEVRYPNFLKQFSGAELNDRHELSKRIDGISGATLSVWAMGRMARQALYFDRVSRGK